MAAKRQQRLVEGDLNVDEGGQDATARCRGDVDTRRHVVEAMLTRSEAFLEGAAMLPPTVQGSGSGGSSDRAKDRREDAMPFIHRVLILIIVHCTLPLLVEAGGWRWGGRGVVLACDSMWRAMTSELRE